MMITEKVKTHMASALEGLVGKFLQHFVLYNKNATICKAPIRTKHK